MKFKTIDLNKKISELEAEVLAFWKKEKIFEKSLAQRKGGEPFVFYEGPPTANARPGVHHVLARVFKDIILRYQTLKGKYVERRAGWDTHGLPVELQVEKKLGFKTKSDIEKFGIAKFNALCKESVWNFKSDWEDLTEKIGFWLKMENPYITYENEYIKGVWQVLKNAWDKDLIYEDFKVITHCPRCQTALSSHEIAQGYQDITEPSVIIKLKILNGKYRDAYILAWTTTPWTLPGNVALAINKNIDYIQFEQNNEKYIIAEKRLEIIDGDYNKIGKVSVNDLIGAKYQPLFQGIFSADEKTKDLYSIISANFVSTEDGTGIVHTAVMYGADDFGLAEQYNLPKIHTVLEDGTFNERVRNFAGEFVKDADRKIIDYLENNQLLYKKFNYTHSYPFCWRCDSPVLYYAKHSWYIAMSKLRDELINANENINWIPPNLKHGRFGQWLEEIKDWAISRERYWGTPLPIWRCQKCNQIKMIVENEKLNDIDLHRPYIDKVQFECDKCGGEMTRESYVCDVWFDSGAMPFASGEFSQNRFPADYICEAVDQTRGWFYTLLAISVLMERGNPYKNVISLGHVNDEFGKKMSKSKGNIIDPWEMVEKYGADSLRYYFYAINEAAESKSFTEKDLAASKNRVISTLLNVYNFFVTYSRIDNWQGEKGELSSLDEWILARLAQLNSQVDKNLSDYEILKAARSIGDFISDFSLWYIRRNRKNRSHGFYATTHQVLKKLAIIISPFMPFLAEQIWQGLKQEGDIQSVHLADYLPAEKINQPLIKEIKAVREMASLALAKRAENKIRVRQPLAKLTVESPQPISQENLAILAEEINVKEIELKTGKNIKVNLDTKLTPELLAEGKKRELVRLIQDLRKKAGYQYSQKVVIFMEKIPADLRKYLEEIEKETTVKFVSQSPKKIDAEEQFENSKIVVGS